MAGKKRAAAKKPSARKATKSAPRGKTRSKPAKAKAAKSKPAKTGAAKSRPMGGAPRADYGQPIDDFIARQPLALRAILEALRELVEEAAPEAQSALKWGQPFFTLNGKMLCALGAHRAHVNLILVGPPQAFADPRGRLTGAGKGGRHLKLTSVDELPRADVRSWLQTSLKAARAAGK